MDKKDMRARYLHLRRAMLVEEVTKKNSAILERLESLLAFQEAEVYLMYVSSKDNEVDTTEVIGHLLGEKKTVLVPIAQANRVLEWSHLTSLSELEPGRFGILEPKVECRRLVHPPREGAVAITPGVAFTVRGYRIGYGGGYYDRFLSIFGGVSIGLAFEVQMAPAIPVGEFDVAVDYVVTESRSICCTTGIESSS